MRKIISILLAFILVTGISAVSFAYIGYDGEYKSFTTTENCTYTVRNPDYANILGYIDIDVTFEYDGKMAKIIEIKDNSWVNPNYRLNGSVIQSGDADIALSYTCVPLFTDVRSQNYQITLTAKPDGILE